MDPCTVASLVPFTGGAVAFGEERFVAHWRGDVVRQTFIDYFTRAKGHTFVPSSATVPHDDPTLLFANSGMTQFKPIFQGIVDPASPMARLKSAANSQKCIRAGGKHNDLEDVGKDVYHHTFFEMLGNWSFGDYFKKEAVAMAWELLTVVYGLPKNRLYVTYFGGNAELNLPADEEARRLWLEIGFEPDRVIPFGMKENFWEMGESGPCGPCSEIHFDRIGGGRNVSHLVNMDDPDVLEIWNLVFMQFNREADGSLRPLPNKHVDTGMGFERLTSVLQNKRSNYDSDIFVPIFDAIERLSGCRPYTGKVGRLEDLDGIDMAYRVVADHIRTLTFAVSDGGIPSNDGRGYVLRRILRRAIRYAHEKLSAAPGFFAELVDVVVDRFGAAFPEIVKNPANVKAILLEEEVQFRRTLERGIVQFRKFAKASLAAPAVGAAEEGAAAAQPPRLLSGLATWRLYDTYGFPVDLTRLMAEEAGLAIDEAGFEAAQAEAKEISRGTGGGDGDDRLSKVVVDVHMTNELEAVRAIPITDDSFKYAGGQDISVTLLAIIDPTVGIVERYGSGEEGSSASSAVGLIFDRTNFYAEAGGQLYDVGRVMGSGEDSLEFVVEAVRAYGGYVLHVGHLRDGGELCVGMRLDASIDMARRSALMSNHTATHLLNYAIRQVYPESEADQKGSLVAPDRLRFDYNMASGMAVEAVGRIEAIVADFISRNAAVTSRVLPLAQAMALPSLRAVFGETYPDPVRVVAVGAASIDDIVAAAGSATTTTSGTSIELCGGTHVAASGEIRAFVVLSEGAIAKGIRRIVAVTGDEAAEAVAREARLTATLDGLVASFQVERPEEGDDLSEAVKVFGRTLEEASISLIGKAGLSERLSKLRGDLIGAQKALRATQSKAAIEAVLAAPGDGEQAAVVVRRIDVGDNGKALLDALNVLKKESRSGLLYSSDAKGGRIHYYSVVCDDHAARLDASKWAEAFGEAIQGRSGGKAGAAQGSAPLCGDSDEALESAQRLAEQFASSLTLTRS